MWMIVDLVIESVPRDWEGFDVLPYPQPRRILVIVIRGRADIGDVVPTWWCSGLHFTVV